MEPIVKLTMVEQQLQHLHQLAEATVLLRQHPQLEDKVDPVVVVLIISRHPVKETLLQLLLVKEMMEQAALIQGTVGLLAEAAEPMLLAEAEVVREAMELVQEDQEETEQPMQ
tara:strand:- start:14 stop:352 length:339 start_codon:yes stop_codon:yes gene_type:complete